MNIAKSDSELVLEALEKKQNLVAMLAPSFVIDFSYPQIIGKLKRLGFAHVVEVSRGAIETNCQIIKLSDKKGSRYITAPCPTIVRLIRKKYPKLIPFLAPADSPMVATAKIVREVYPGFTPVFIGPCLAKKLEAREDYPDLGIIALTFKEIDGILKGKNINDEDADNKAEFDFLGAVTRLYSISGGLAQSASLKDLFSRDEYRVVSGPGNIGKALEEFMGNSNIRILDILFCEGGCINGPGIISKEPIDKRREKVVSYWNK